MAEPIHILRHHAMATYFELRVAGGDAAYAGQAAAAAFAVIDRTESRLSRFLEGSEISRINRLAAGEVLRVSPEVCACLLQALELQALTRGAFDPGVGTENRQSGKAAKRQTLERERVGTENLKIGKSKNLKTSDRGQVLIDAEGLAVSVDGAVSLDLGAIGKGFALDLAAEELRAWELPRVLLIGGGSSLLAFTGPGVGSDWKWEVGIGSDLPARRIFLANTALGSSGTAVKGEHILDPRTGRTVPAGRRTWAVAPTAAAADALSTAWMILPRDEIAEICASRPGIGAIIQEEADPGRLWSTALAPELHFGAK